MHFAWSNVFPGKACGLVLVNGAYVRNEHAFLRERCFFLNYTVFCVKKQQFVPFYTKIYLFSTFTFVFLVYIMDIRGVLWCAKKYVGN